MPQTQVEKYLKDLYKVYQYRQALRANSEPVAQVQIPGQGTTVSARDIAMSVMNHPQPHNFKIDSGLAHSAEDDSNPILNLGREVLDSGPVKTTLDILSRPSYAVGGVFDALSGGKDVGAPNAHELGSRLEDIPEKAWAGFVGRDHTTVSDVMNRDTDRQKAPGFERFAEGLVADIATDPTTYIPGGIAVQGAKKVLQGIKGAAKAEKAAEVVEKAAEATEKIETPTVSTTPTSDPSSLQEALSKVPTAAHPNLDIEEPFKTTDVVKEVPQSPTISVRRAIKAALLQSDEHEIGKYKVGDLLRVAKENPEKQTQIDKLINGEVNRIFSSKDYGALYRGKKAATALQFLNKEGSVIGGLNLKQLNQLFKDGVIGTGKVGDEALDLPIHDPEDLKAFMLRNAKGETVSLHQYLEDLGVGVRSGDKEIIKAKPKTVIEKSTQPLSTTESVAWLTKHAGKLSNKELQYLSKATPEQFATRLKELKAKVIVKSFGSADEFATAVRSGIVPAAAAEKIYKTAGVKNLDEFIAKAGTTGKPKSVFEKMAEDLPTWESPTQKIERAAAGDTSTIARPKPGLTPRIVEDLSHALPHAIVENLIDPQDLEKYPFITKIKQAKRTDKTLGAGRARNLHGWHGISQSDVFRTLAKRASARHSKTVAGKDFANYARMRADMMYNDIMPAMRVAEAALRDKGVKFIAGNQESGILLSLTDALDNLGAKGVKKWLFGLGKNRPQVFPTALLDATEVFARAAMNKGDLNLARAAATKILESSPRMTEAGAKELAKAIEGNLPNLMDRVSANYAEESIKMGEAVKSMSDEVIDTVVKSFTNPAISMGEALDDLAKRTDMSAAVARKVKAPQGATTVAKGIIDSELAMKGVEAQGLVEADTAKAFKNAGENESKRIGAKQQASRAVSGLSGADGFVEDLSDIMDVRMQAGLFRSNVPLLNKLLETYDALGRHFVSSFGNEDLHYMVHVNRNVTQSFARMHRQIMQRTWEIANKVYGPQTNEKIAEAFKHLQTSTDFPHDQNMQNIIDSMAESIGIMFNGDIGAFAPRNGLFAGHLNEVMRQYGVPAEIAFQEGVPMIDQKDIWRSWTDIKDPLDLLDKIHAAFQRASIDVTIGRDFSDVAHEWVSNVAKEGFVKIVDSKNKSSLFKFVDDTKFYDKNVVAQLPYLENVLNGSFIKHDRAGLLSLYDSVLHAWKAGVTIYRPGHHVRNLIGDLGLSFLAGVYNPGAYKTAARILAGRASAYKEWDAFATLQGFEHNIPVAAGTPELPTKLNKLKNASKLAINIGGSRQVFDDDTLWRAAFKQGVLPDYSVLEDIAFNDAQKGFKLGGVSLTKPFGGRVQKTAGGLSQSRDHWVRMAHFVDVLQKGNYKSFEEAVQKAGATVRKWHPDGSDLTAFERQVMRRVIPFYSWFRKAIPLVVEALVMHPGRALVVPKGMANFASSMGVDVESLANPFPQDQLFPDWLQDNTLGPQWRGNVGIPGFGQYEGRYYGMNPGDPVTDLGNSYLGSSPVNSILGGLTPVAKIPLELATGNILGTGSSIGDTSDYIDAQIPGISQIANISNTSVTGLDPQQDVQKGRSAPGMDELALTNFLTGLGIKDYSKPNYIRSAQLELRDKLRGR